MNIQQTQLQNVVYKFVIIESKKIVESVHKKSINVLKMFSLLNYLKFHSDVLTKVALRITKAGCPLDATLRAERNFPLSFPIISTQEITRQSAPRRKFRLVENRLKPTRMVAFFTSSPSTRARL